MKLKLLSLALMIGLASCGSSQQQSQNNVSVSSNSDINVQASDVPGFDVNNFAALLKTEKNPQALEQKINTSNNNINNLDLNGDGNIDYVKVVEAGANTLQVVDDTSATGSVTIATLSVTPSTNTMTIQGNQDYCGNNYHYTSVYSPTDWLLMAYLLHPHPFYRPMWHYGYYPGYYGGGYHTRYSHSYSRSSVSRVREYRTNPSSFRSKYGNSTKSSASSGSSYNRRSLSTPTSSQRSYSTRNSSTPVRSGGFGNSNSRSSGRSSFSGSRSSSRGGRR